MTDHFELSTMTGTAAMSGSAAIRRRKRVIAATPSSIASSMFTSISWAPFSTCWRAMSTASSSAPSAMSRANLREPVTFVRSPTLTNALPGGGITSGSRPDRRVVAGRLRDLARRQAGDRGGDRGDVVRRRAAAAAGDVEQAVRAPTRRGPRPSPRASRRSRRTRSAGRRSGRRRRHGRRRASSTSRCSRSCFGPSAQLSPTMSGSAWRMLCQNASTVWPDSVRPEASTMVPEMISGSALAGLVEERLDREDRGLGVERVEDRLDEEDVGAALDQARRPTRGRRPRAPPR